MGNAAAVQQQNDVWGEVLDVLLATHDADVPVLPEERRLVARMLDRLLSTWHQPDHGLWEIRGPRRHFLHSKLLARVGLDRAIAFAESGDATALAYELDRHRRLRAHLRTEILDRGFSSQLRAFAQSYGSARLDASVLLISRYGFLPWSDPRVVATVETIQRDLTHNGLVLRYTTSESEPNLDGLHGSEGAFVATSFWLADALYELDRGDDAIALFERLLGLRNDVGLLSEEYDPVAGHHLGNTPQAFSHAALVTTALRLDAQPAGIVRTLAEEAS
ncbi:glycoside hydrolase family 15 protein [Kribbella sp. NPDC050820]|uniref:glycoside hydrolase family 15 protein n=1 Tax=Kribbella sp. NPDC050820 TaxID=3155408 RepID=UPI0033F1F584